MAYFDKKEGSLEEAMKASLTDGSKEEYQKFFNAAMKKFKISSPSELKTDADKKKFFDYVDKNYKGEKSEAVKTLIGKLKEWSFSSAKPVEEKKSPLGVDEKSKKEVEEQLSAMAGKSLSMREALKKVWSGQEGKNPFEDADKKKMKEKKDFAKGSKAATGEPAAKVEIDPKIKD